MKKFDKQDPLFRAPFSQPTDFPPVSPEVGQIEFALRGGKPVRGSAEAKKYI
jgi:hypothetical protein